MYDDSMIIGKKYFANRAEAIRYYSAAMENCNDKTMHNEYAKIFCQLMEGKEFN